MLIEIHSADLKRICRVVSFSTMPPGSGANNPHAAPSTGSNGALPYRLAVSVLRQPHDHRGEAHRPADPLEVCRMDLYQHLVGSHCRAPNSIPPCDQRLTCVCTLLTPSKPPRKTVSSRLYSDKSTPPEVDLPFPSDVPNPVLQYQNGIQYP